MQIRTFFVLNDTFDNVGTHIKNLQLLSSIFFCFSKRKRWQKKMSPGDFDFPPDPLEPTRKTPSVFLDFSREICNSPKSLTLRL